MEANNINNILYIKHRHNKYYTNKKKLKVNRVNLFGLGDVWNNVIKVTDLKS